MRKIRETHREIQGVNKDETESSGLKSSYKTSYGATENLFQHMHPESNGGHEHSYETGQGTELSSYKPSKKISNTTQKEKFKNSVSSAACCRDYENKENSNEQFSINPWAILDHPHTARQRGIDRMEKDHCDVMERSVMKKKMMN
jgi:hypothetical protein